MAPDPAQPHRGDIWLVDLNPTVGHEQSGVRPAVILSVDRFNHGPAGLVVVLPVTTVAKGIRSHIRVLPSHTGFREESYIKCEEPRCVSKERLRTVLGSVDSKVMTEVGRVVSILLGI